MDGDEGEGIRLSKRFSDTVKPGEVDYKTKSGTAWSHSYLNQKPWHPLSYPNQRRKWIAEQTHAQRERRAEEVSREYAQEQEFFRQTALISKKEKEKVEMMKAVSFMYVRPPGYNVESAKAAEVADEKRRQGQGSTSQEQSVDGASTSMPSEPLPARDSVAEMKKKPRPKDVFGRPLPTEEEFEVLKNAPRLETGVPARSKPFGVEVRNVKCLRCGNYGHQSGDRECPLKDVIMPNEESRLKRDDPLTAIMAHTDPSEPLKWELKQKPGMSPPRGGFNLDDPNQQIVAEDIFDEYGGFLSGGTIPELLTSFSSKPKKKKSLKKIKHKRQSSPSDGDLRTTQDDRLDSTDDEMKANREKRHKKKKKQKELNLNLSDDLESYRHNRRSRIKHSYASDDSESDWQPESRKGREKHSEELDSEEQHNDRRGIKTNVHSYSSKGSDSEGLHKDRTSRKRGVQSHLTEVSDFKEQHKVKCRKRNASSFSSEDSDSKVQYRNRRNRKKNHRAHSSENSDHGSQRKSRRSRKRDMHSCLSEDSDSEGQRKDRSTKKNLYSSKENCRGHHQRSRDRCAYSSDDSDSGGHGRNENSRRKYSSDSDDSRTHWQHRSRETRVKRSSSEDDFDGQHRSRKTRLKHSDHHSYEDSRRHTDTGSKQHHHHHRH